MNKSLAALIIASAICGGAPLAHADFIEVDISSYLNGNVLLGANNKMEIMGLFVPYQVLNLAHILRFRLQF
jgi:hypothetical protein